MKPRVTSQEKILEQAMEIAKREGVDKLSVRKLSSACGIAIGSVYNYFPNMDALMTAMADAFWNGIFKDQKKLYRKGMGFTSFLEQYYNFLYVKMAPYDGSWIKEMDGKIPKEDAISLLHQALVEDTRVNGSIWNMEFHPESFCEYVFTNLMALLQSGEGNPRFFVFLLENLLYKK